MGLRVGAGAAIEADGSREDRIGRRGGRLKCDLLNGDPPKRECRTTERNGAGGGREAR